MLKHDLSRSIGTSYGSKLYFFFSVNFKAKNPMTPATNEESKITSFALLIITASSNASKVINIDMVNPIPPKNPTAKMDFQFNSAGNLQSLRVTAK